MKKIFACIILLFMSFSCFALCDNAPPTTDPTFCAKFKEIALCHCKVDAPKGTPCTDVGFIYRLMVMTYGSQDAACKYAAQHGSEKRTTADQCNKDWNCYRLGAGDCNKKCM